MIPIRDNVIARTPPIVMWVLIGLNVVCFFLQTSLEPAALDRLIRVFSLIPARFLDGSFALDSYTLITSMFLHGGMGHLLGNMWTLWLFGDNVEDRMGPTRFTIFYLLCGIAAGVVHIVSSGGPNNPGVLIPTIGASGAISGVMGAYMVLYPTAELVMLFPIIIYPLFFRLPAVVYLGGWFLIQFLSGRAEAQSPNMDGGIAFWAHIGGFIAGIVLLPLFVQPSSARPSRHPEEFHIERGWSRFD